MNIRKRLLALFIAIGMVFLSGCDKVVELTAEEKEIITLYAAKVVSKHNVRLSQGLVRYRESAANGTEESDDQAEEQPETEEENTEEQTEEKPEEETENPDENNVEEEPSETEEASDVTLTEAFGIDGIEFRYKDATVYNDLQGSNSYIEEPAQGNKYLGISFDVTNTTNDDIELSLLTTQTGFTATLGSETADAKSLAMLLDDLPTFTGTIKAGDSKTLSIYFEFSEEAVKDLSSLKLSADIGGKKSNIALK